MGLWGAATHLVSNQEVRKVPVISKLFTQGEGVGIKKGYNGMKSSYKDMRNADQALGASSGAEAKWKAYREAQARANKPENVAQADAMLAQIAAERKANGINSEAAAKSLAENVTSMGKGVGRYFGATDMRGQTGRFRTAATRVGAAGVGYMGLATGARYVSGGGMTYNNKGEQDIAGIPFI